MLPSFSSDSCPQKIAMKSRSIITLLILLLVLALSLSIANAQTKFPTGQVIEKVICLDDASQSYALYLPANYSPEKSWPILYGFDAGGRGKQPVELFHEAAEKYGWIVVGSNNSRNGPGVPLNEIINALWRDTHQRFNLDEKRAYTTGMSGGARVATTMAIGLNGYIAGVIACGAGFPAIRTPQKDMTFAYFSIAGIEDPNLFELHLLEDQLSKAGMTHQLLTFDGEHTWPPKNILLEAVEWIEAQAIKSGRSSKDETHINTLYHQGLVRAQQFESSPRLYAAWLRYRILSETFNALRPVDEAVAAAQRLQNTKDVAAMISQLKAADRLQDNRSREITGYLQALSNSETQMQATADAKNLIAQLRKKADEANISTERIVARRLLTFCAITFSEEATNAMFRKNYSAAVSYLTIAAEIRSNNPQTWYRLASAQAQNGDKKRALESLKRAIEKGFADGARLEQAAEFSALQKDKEFQLLMQRLKNSTPTN